MKNIIYGLILLLLSSVACADQYKVLVVMSYEEYNLWSIEIIEGIKSVLEENSHITYFYMDTKENIGGGKEKAKEAYELYKTLQPDGVITADDNAQSMFVVPYLKDKVDTPISFCGVNDSPNTPEKYGYPASNVTGIIETAHTEETLAFLKQLIPTIETFSSIVNDGPTGIAITEEIERNKSNYILKLDSNYRIKTVDDLKTVGSQLNGKVDSILIDAMEGIKDNNGTGITSDYAMKIITSVYHGPIMGANKYHVEQGALLAVVKTGQEQGRTAAKKLLQAMEGTPVSEIPITTNYKGQRLINIKELNKRKIIPPSYLFLGTKLIYLP